VSRRVAELEARLRTRLLQRTTRRLGLTDAGRTCFEYCARIVAEVEEAERAVTLLQEHPVGLLRVTAPLSFAFLGTFVAEFIGRYPQADVELVCTDRVVNLVEERFDVAVRAGPMKDSSLIARHLGTFRRTLVASPGWVRRHGKPRRVEDLATADWLLFGSGGQRTVRVRLAKGKDEAELSVRPRLLANEVEQLREAALAGAGVTLLPTFECVGDLETKRLVDLLPGWSTEETPINAVYPSTRHLSPKVKLFVDHLQARLAATSWARRSR
jgi:DNA-binding transcriptional LysR family regulator